MNLSIEELLQLLGMKEAELYALRKLNAQIAAELEKVAEASKPPIRVQEDTSFSIGMDAQIASKL